MADKRASVMFIPWNGKLRVSPATVAPLSANTYKPVRHKGDQCNDAQAEGQMPMRGPVAKQGLLLKCLLQQRQADRAQHGAPQTTAAAQDNHQQNQTGLFPGQ